MIVIAHHHISKQARNKKLHTDQHKEYAHHRPETIGQRSIENDFFHQHPDQDAASHKRKEDTHSAEKMQRPIGILAPEPDSEHIDESFDRSFPGVFGRTVDARMMRHFDFGHPETVECEEGWHKAMHLAEEIHFAETFCAIGFQAAAGIMDAVFDKNSAQQIRPAGKNTLHERILALETPSGNHIVSFINFCEEKRDISRIILEVTIKRDDDLAFCSLDTRIKGSRLTKILAKAHQSERRQTNSLRYRLVSRTVINKKNLKRPANFLDSLMYSAMQFPDVPLFIVKRNYDR